MEGAPLSLRAYALSRRRRGLPLCSHVGLAKAIERGALTAPAVVGGKVADSAEADRQLAELHPVDAARAALRDGTGAPARGVPDDMSLSQIRREREHVRLRREVAEAALREGRLMLASKVRADIVEAGRRMRDRLLSVPARLAPECAGLAEREAYDKLERDIGR